MARSERGPQPRNEKGWFQSYDYKGPGTKGVEQTVAALPRTIDAPEPKSERRTSSNRSSGTVKTGSQPRDEKGRFAPKVAPLPAEERKKISTWKEGRIDNKASGGNLYGIVVRVTKNGKEISHHNIVQATPVLDRSGKQLIRDRVAQKYGVKNINIEIVQTVNMWSGERVERGIVR